MKTHKIQFPHKPIVGGPGSFQIRFTNQLLSYDHIKIIDEMSNEKPDTILVINGTKRILWLLIKKIQGVQIVHRLDGINTNYDLKQNSLKSIVLKFVRTIFIFIIANFLANKIIFISEFVKRDLKKIIFFNKNSKVILNSFSNSINESYKNKTIDVICVEGEINDIFSIQILNHLKDQKIDFLGKVKDELKSKIDNKNIIYHGFKSREDVTKLLDKSKVYLSLEKNPPCPNSVIEAISRGLPVIGLDSGSLYELVGDAGKVINLSFSSKNEISKKSLDELKLQLDNLIKDYKSYFKISNKRTLEKFNLAKMTEQYIKFIKR